MELTSDPLRLLSAAGLLAAYALLCLAIAAARGRRRRAARALEPAAGDSPTWLVAYASQTGTAESIAWHTAETLHLAGVAAHLCSLAEVDEKALGQARRLLVVASTCGEGDAPDNGIHFARRLLADRLALGHLHYGLLALGDSSYANFCGFGRQLHGLLQARGAQPLFAPVEADRCDPAALEAWKGHLSHLAGTGDAPDWEGPAFTGWRLMERRLLNAGSAGGPVYHLELAPEDGAPLPDWQSGDLVQVQPPGEPERPRDYSVASIPADGRIHLLVRCQRRSDGSPGLASGWLTGELAVGAALPLRLRPNRLFRLQGNAGRPLILIGNGTGLAGLRAHLRSRAQAGAGGNWLIFGERNERHDFHYREEIEAWQAEGILDRVDLVFSRDQGERRHVQDRLREVGQTLRQWVEAGAAIYVCGSLQGMAAGVDRVLAELLGEEALAGLNVAGRYRRDVY